MGYIHTMHLRARVKPRTQLRTIRAAFAPLFEYLGYNPNHAFSKEHYLSFNGDEFTFDRQTGNLSSSTYGEVSYNYFDLVQEVANNLSPLLLTAGEFSLYDHDTGDIDNAKTVRVFGPSPAIVDAYIAERDITQGFTLLKPHVPKRVYHQIVALVTATRAPVASPAAAQ